MSQLPPTIIESSEKRKRNRKIRSIDATSNVQYIDLNYSEQNPNLAVQLTCNTKQFYSLKISTLNEDVVRMEIPPHDPNQVAQSLSIDAKQLLNWPGICTILHLGDVKIRRQLVANYCREIIVVTNVDATIERSTNKLEYHRLNRSGNGSELSSLMLDAFLHVYLNARSEGSLLPLRINELGIIFNEIKDDLAPFERIMKGVTYSRYLTRDHFVRKFYPKATDAPTEKDDSTEPSSSMKEPSSQRVYVRETINPEVHLTVERCPFVMGSDEEIWSKAVYDEFAMVFDGNRASLRTLNATYKSCLTFECLECNGMQPMTGILSVYSAKQHIAMHYQDKPAWTCSNCNLQQSQEELASIGWKHYCL